MVRAKRESRHRAERIKIALDTIHANGGIDNRLPWGAIAVGAKHNKRIQWTPQAREYIPQIYARIITGQSLATVARWLEAEHVAPTGIAKTGSSKGKSGKWWPRSIGHIVRNPVYAGLRVNGQQQTTAECEPLVDDAVWAAAGESLKDRPKRGRS